jgi:hypothetical protein
VVIGFWRTPRSFSVMEISDQTIVSQTTTRATGLAPFRGIGLGVLLGSALWVGLGILLSLLAGHC